MSYKRLKVRLSKETICACAIIGCAAFILLIPVLLNGFPFIFPDSGDYLVFTPHVYRSPYYGLFIFFFHLNRWIWGPVIAQALIVSHLLWLMLKLSGARWLTFNMIVLALLLTFFSSAPWFVGFIIADIFTPIMFITMYILAFYFGAMSWPLRIYLILLTSVATAAHISDLALALGMFSVLFVMHLLRGAKYADAISQMKILLVPIVLTAAAVLLFNTLIFERFALAPAGNSFLMANLIEGGPARAYLTKSCPQAGYKICAFVDRLPKIADDLLWDPGMYQKLGGFTGMARESETIVIATLKQYPVEVGRMIARNFFSGLTAHAPAAEFRADYQVPSMIDLLMVKFGHKTVANYLNSAEMRDALPYDLIANIDSIVVPLSFFVLLGLGLFAARRGNRDHAILAFVMVAAVLGDTLLCTTISGVHDRYQARVTWLLPMAVFVILASMIADRDMYLKNKTYSREKGE